MKFRHHCSGSVLTRFYRVAAHNVNLAQVCLAVQLMGYVEGS